MQQFGIKQVDECHITRYKINNSNNHDDDNNNNNNNN